MSDKNERQLIKRLQRYRKIFTGLKNIVLLRQYSNKNKERKDRTSDTKQKNAKAPKLSAEKRLHNR